MSFTIYEDDIIMCTGENILSHFINISSSVIANYPLPKLTIENKQQHHNNLDTDNYHGITTIFTSKDGRYFCVCTNRKQLCLYERKTRDLISNRVLVRAASRAIFTPNNDIVVADKSGDAYIYETANPCEPGKLILGHLSMLLDCLVTDNSRYIVTADRDEKIRVSSFPNAYNIVSYCLGHEKFVTAVFQLPHNHDILVSAGGDGELKFWDYVAGREVASYNFGEKIPIEESLRLNDNLKLYEVTETVETLPVKHMRMEKIEDTRTLLILSFYSSKRILVYSIGEKFELEYLETLILEDEPLECLLTDRQLWILDDRGLKVYKLEGQRFKLDSEKNLRIEELNDKWRSLRKSVNKQSLFPILYKRKYDNVQEYHDRKKSRLGN